MNRSFPILTCSIAALISASTTTLAVDNNWTGATSTDWNTDSNWSDPHGFGSPHVPNNAAGHPGDEDAVINVTPTNIATITATPLVNSRDIKVGIGAGTNGQVNHLAGTATTASGSWVFVGVDGGTGRYNLANTAATGGTFTGLGTGSGSLNVGGADPGAGRLYVGGQDNANGGNGTMNINTTGTVKIGNDFVTGRPNGTGVVNMDAGTINQTGGWTVVGLGGNGTVNMSGGTVTTGRETIVGLDPTGVGTLNIKGGSYSTGSTNNTFSYIGRNGGNGTINVADTTAIGGALTGLGLGSGSLAIGANNRLFVGGADTGTNERGTGKLNVNTTGTVSIANDLVVGNGGGTGIVNLDAGTITTGGWNFIGRAENGTGSSGTVRIRGGLLNAGGGRTYVGRGDSFGSIEMSGGEYRNTGDWFSVGESNLANANPSSMLISGGLVQANQLTIGGSPEQAGNGIATLSGPTAQLQTNDQLWIGNGAGSTGVLTVSAGSVQVANWLAIGRTGASGVLTISGTGLVQKTNTNGSLELNNNGGVGSSAIVNLDGGTLMVNDITGGGGGITPANLYLNGGTLTATVSNTDFIHGDVKPIIKAGGAIIDTNGLSIVINKVLGTDPTSTGGGLNKKGAADLTLTQTNSYTGVTTVTAGSLILDGATAQLGTGNVAVLNTAITLSISTGVTDAIVDTSILSLAGGGAVATADAGYLTLGLSVFETVGGLRLNNVLQAVGTYGSTVSAATFKNDEFFSGPGVLNVVPEPATALLLTGALGMLVGVRRRRL